VGTAQADLLGRQRQRAELHAPARPRNVHTGRHDRDLLGRLVSEQAQLRLAVCLQGPVPVEVVLLDVQEQSHIGRECLRVLGLKARHLADDGGLGVDLADQRGQRRAHVPRQRDRQARRAPDRPEQLGGGGLPVRAGHRHEPVRQEPPGELELSEHRQPALAGRRDHRRLVRHTRALHDARRAVEQLHAVHAHTRVDVVRQLGRARVDRHHLAVLPQHSRGRRARAREPDDEIRALGEGRPHPGIDAW
jgi:hypothetical protein